MNDESSTSDLLSWRAACTALDAAGFDVVAVVDPDALPAALKTTIAADASERLILVGASGARLWSALQLSSFATGPDPVDDYSASVVRDVLQRCDAVAASSLRYPGDGVAPLIQLGHWLGWTSPSPLGLGINGTHGLWFAFRAFAVVTPVTPDALTVTLPRAVQSPCLGCADTPCVSHCPAGAVAAEREFQIETCLDFRSRPSSSCAESCLSRLACPVGGASRYPAAQFAYHQRRALDGMQRWLNRNDNK